ncbi:hypothetical protein F4555_000587 [Mobiluncus mulieris]|uniref:hypothetical protein n=1 Tax=Mobiluncus mulieris TaxID=2052 RepID=UPI001358A238|nr:hypothetical protein [Mobiluncus mulieris]MBB5845791.1 hypothetical protein [Mobiluncus mulieris]
MTWDFTQPTILAKGLCVQGYTEKMPYLVKARKTIATPANQVPTARSISTHPTVLAFTAILAGYGT